MKDCLGQIIEIGDYVAAPARSAAILYLKTGVVCAIEGKRIRINWEKNEHYMSAPAEGWTELPKTLVVL